MRVAGPSESKQPNLKNELPKYHWWEIFSRDDSSMVLYCRANRRFVEMNKATEPRMTLMMIERKGSEYHYGERS